MADNETPDPPVPQPGEDFWEQPALDTERSEDGTTLTVRYAGDYEAVKAFSESFTPGAPHPTDGSFTLSNIRLERYEGPSGRLELVYTDNASGDGSAGGDGKARVKKTSWSLTTTPVDIPIWRYCGPSDQNAKRYRIEPWMNEQDPDLKASWRYTDPNGVVRELTVNDQYIAAKILQGFETVQRHYPTIRKRTQLTKGDVTPDGELDHIKVGGPAGAPAYMVAFALAWLKTGEQIDIAEDGSQTLVEEWIGGDAFDENFYGEDPWRWAWGSI